MKRNKLLSQARRICLTFSLIIIISSLCFSQQTRKIQGIITTVDNKPLEGVSVMIKNSDKGTITNGNGEYSLTINPVNDRALTISFTGYISKDIPINNETSINVSLSPDFSRLHDIVVTGYSKQRKVDLTGAIDIVKVDAMTKQPGNNVATLLQGQASGVTVISTGQPGEAPQIRIRGINTFGNNTPLFIVDGVPTQDITNVSPDDIESMQVLKDAGAASIYGSRASNGVIIVTTKKGKGNVKVNYNGYYGKQYPLSGNVYNKLTPIEDAQLKWMALKNSGVTSITDELYGNGTEPRLPDYLSPAGAMEGDPRTNPELYHLNPTFSINEFSSFYQITKANKEGTDWYHEVFKPAPMTNHGISISQGGEKGNFFLSMNYFEQQGVLINTYDRRYNVRANGEFNISKNIRVGENLGYTFNTGRLVTGNSDQTNSVRNAATTPEIIPVYDIMGNFGGARGTYLFGDNPVAFQDRTKNNLSRGNRVFGNLYTDITFLKLFTIHSSFGGDISSGYSRRFNYPAYETYLPPNQSSYSESSNFNTSWIWTNTLNFQKDFNDVHKLSILIGSETIEQEFENLGGTTQNYFSFDPNYTTLVTGSGTATNTSGRSAGSLFSIFGNLNYSYKNKILFGGTLRRDGSSRFINEVYGVFPALSIGWRLTQENFMKSVTWVNELKIRGSWGIMGNQLNVDPINGYYTFFGDRLYSYYDINGTNNSIVPGFRLNHIGNPDAKWEKDINSNIGLDATILNGKLDLTIDYYHKDIKDLLFNPPILATAGRGTPPFVNIARVRNVGVDFSVTNHARFAENITLNSSLSFTTYNNRILKVTDQADYFWTSDSRRFGSNFVRNEVGHPIGAFYGYKIVGFWNSESEIEEANNKAQNTTGDPSTIYQEDIGIGRFRYADVNGDGIINTEDRTFLGNPNPNFSYGLNLDLKYKDFDFSIFFYGVQGNNLWNNLKWWLDFYSSFNTGKSKTALYDSWRPDHQDAKVAIQENNGFASTNQQPNSYFVEKGSYLRAKNAMVGYTIPAYLTDKLGINRVRVYFQATNLFTITNYSGPDPEISGTPVDFGIDGGVYPHTHQYLLGINLQF